MLIQASGNRSDLLGRLKSSHFMSQFVARMQRSGIRGTHHTPSRIPPSLHPGYLSGSGSSGLG